MEQEQANWCRFAQLIIKIGGKVLRRFFLLESLTSMFTNYSDRWNEEVHNPLWIAYSSMLWRDLKFTPRNSAQSAADALDTLLTSWKERGTKATTLMEETIRLQQWLKDIENPSLGNASEGVKDTLKSWSSQIERKMEQLNSMNTVLRLWDSVFQDNLFGAQVRLQEEIESYDERLSNCIKELKELNKPSGRDLEQVIHNFETEFHSFKKRCTILFQEFEDASYTLLAQWENEVPGCIEDTKDCKTLVKFLTNFRTNIAKNVEATELADCLCESRYNELCTFFLASADSVLPNDTSEKTERSPSFKEILFTDSIKNLLSSTERPKLGKPYISALKAISSSTDLEAVDISLLITMLQKSKFVHSKVYNEDEDLSDWDTSISADILCVRSHRDNIIAHATQAKMSSDLFDTLWREASVLCCRIAARCGGHFETTIRQEIDDMMFLSLWPGRELRQQIVEWCQNDILVQLSTSPGSSLCLEMLNTIEKVREDITTITKDPEWYECDKCKEKTTTEYELLRHACRQDPTVYVCRNCKNEFGSYSFLCHRCTRV